MATRTSRGQCQFCGKIYGKSGMSRHLQSCPARGERRAANPATQMLHLVVSGRYAPEYWLHLDVPAQASLADLDNFLRDIWLECCGHLSAFTIGGVSYVSYEDEGWDMDDESMEVPLGQVLHPGDTARYEYDFGSTTDLTIKVIEEEAGVLGHERIEILAQNEPPSIPCHVCGQRATQVCAQCSWNDQGWLCDGCSEAHACGEEMLLPVVNSPRVGVCAYTG